MGKWKKITEKIRDIKIVDNVKYLGMLINNKRRCLTPQETILKLLGNYFETNWKSLVTRMKALNCSDYNWKHVYNLP